MMACRRRADHVFLVGIWLAAAACGGAQSTPTSAPVPLPVCPAPTGTGPAQSHTAAWTIPAQAGRDGVVVQLPFPVSGQGVVEVVTTTVPGLNMCTCLGPVTGCVATCTTTGRQEVTLAVCDGKLNYPPGQWQVGMYCRGNSANACETPLPAGGVAGTTTATYKPR